MSNVKLRDWVEIIGIFAVVSSLIFVGLQMKQTQEISMSQAYQSRASISVDWSIALASNTLALSANRKAKNGKMEEITPEEYDSARWLLLGVYIVFDNSHYQYINGYVSDELWLQVRNNIKEIMENPLAREIFDGLRGNARPTFRAQLIEIANEIDMNPTNG
jgi:hypothetical protein